MEESSNGKLEETHKDELQAEEKGKDVFVEDVGDFNPVGESGKDIDIADISEYPNKRDIKIEDFSESADKTFDVKDSSSSSSNSDEEKDQTAEESPQIVDSKQLEEGKEITESIEPPVLDTESKKRNEDKTAGEDSPFLSDFPSNEIDGKTLPNFEKSNGFPPAVTDLESNSSFENGNESKSIAETSVVAKRIEETGLAYPDEKNVDHPVVTESSGREENGGESSAQALVVYKASSDNGGGECDKPEISESRVNPVGCLAFDPISHS